MSKRKKRRRVRKSIKIFFLLILIVVGFFVYNKYFNKDNNLMNNVVSNVEEFFTHKKEKLNEYNKCLSKEYSDDDLTDKLKEKIDELDAFFQKYSVSIGYEDTVTKFSYKYSENKKYYAASTIKMLDALYLYKKAADGEVYLDETMTYTSKYLRGASLKMGSKSYGTKVKLKDLVSYAVIYSDNIAHAMLLDYIGKSTLREYGRSLGATYTLNSDDFGEINVNDALAYLKELNTYLNTETEQAKELKGYFINSQQNYLNFPDQNIEAVQKYGEYPGYYHENGIVYVEHPYLVTILTNYSNNEKLIRNLNSKILELHNTFNEERANSCKSILELK